MGLLRVVQVSTLYQQASRCSCIQFKTIKCCSRGFLAAATWRCLETYNFDTYVFCYQVLSGFLAAVVDAGIVVQTDTSYSTCFFNGVNTDFTKWCVCL